MYKKDYVKFITICVLIAFCVSFFSSIANQTCRVLAFDNSLKGGIKVEVLDEDGNAISGAKVYVCEISECFETGKNGQTPNISLPVLPDTRFLEICKKDFGEVTILVTKDGYCPTCMTGVIVRSGVTRLGPKVVLKVGEKYRHVADGIDEAWLKRMCEKYR
ncbi:MAG: hypothetical protein R3Y65_02110 [Bacillota bacterium]